MSDTTLESGAGWGVTTFDCGINYDGKFRLRGGRDGVSVSSMDFGSVMAQLRSVAICFTDFFVSSSNESEVTVDLGFLKESNNISDRLTNIILLICLANRYNCRKKFNGVCNSCAVG